jgi:hypothetical protein
MTRRQRTSDSSPSSGELFFGLVPWIVGPAALLPMFPGFLLCMPGIVLAALLLIPVIALAVVATVAVAIVEVPRRLVRRTRRLANRDGAMSRAPFPGTSRG